MAFEKDQSEAMFMTAVGEWPDNTRMDGEDMQYKKDAAYLQSFYPPMCRELLAYVREVCDQAEYEGSPMFDEFPDKVRIWKMMDAVYEMAAYMEKMYRPVLEEDENVETLGHCMSCRGTDHWLRNLISALMVNELHYRRRRYFRRKRRLKSPAW